MIVVGDALCCDLDGRMDRRILACCFGLFALAWSCFSRCCFFAVVMSLFSLFLWFLCLVMFSCVGFLIRFWNSLCCHLIWFFIFGLHHAFLRRFGTVSYFSMIDFIACWMLWKCSLVVVFCSLSIASSTLFKV